MDIKQKSFHSFVDDYMKCFVAKHRGDLDNLNLYEKFISQVEKSLIRSVLNITQGNQSKTSSILGINRTTLRKKMKGLNIKLDAEN